MKFGYTMFYVNDVSSAVAFFDTASGRFPHESGDYGELATGDTVLAFASYKPGSMNFPDGFTRLAQLDLSAGIGVALVTDCVA
jgi:lactoylglutathione lyase